MSAFVGLNGYIKDYARAGNRGRSIPNIAPMGELIQLLRGVRGIISFEVNTWGDAQGHIDVWNGNQCRYMGYWGEAENIFLWRL